MMFRAAQVTFIGTRNTSGKTRGLQYCVVVAFIYYQTVQNMVKI